MHWTKNDSVERRAPLPTQWNTAAVDEQKKGSSSTTWTKWETISNTQCSFVDRIRLASLAQHPASFRECILCFWSMRFHEPVAPFTCISSWIVNIYIFFHSFRLSPWHHHGSEQNRIENNNNIADLVPMRCIYITLLQQTYARLKKIDVVPAKVHYIHCENFGVCVCDWLLGL